VNRRTITRFITFSTGVALGLNLLTGAAFASSTSQTDAGNPSDAKYSCSDSHNSDTGHGANNSGGYQSTCDPTDFGGNGQEFGPGLQTGKPCAGCVGNADDKNPPGQYPDGSDRNSGYECDGRDRPSANQQGNGNHGIGDENPAHTGCTSTNSVVTPPPTCPDGSAMPAEDRNDDAVIDLRDCTPDVPFVCAGSNTPAMDVDGNGVITMADCNHHADDAAVTCPDGSAMPNVDQDGNGVINAADCTHHSSEGSTPVVEKSTTEVPVVTGATPPVVAEAAPAVLADDVEAAPSEALAATVPGVGVAAEKAAVVQPKSVPAQVLGVQYERASAPLAFTGAGSAVVLAALAGLILLALGFGLVQAGRRSTDA
jgi:hypothetical protein